MEEGKAPGLSDELRHLPRVVAEFHVALGVDDDDRVA